MARTIKDSCGKIYYLSEEIYKVISGSWLTELDWLNDRRVRLISGVEYSDMPGHHFSSDHITVCPVNCKSPTWWGVKKIELVPISLVPNELFDISD